MNEKNIQLPGVFFKGGITVNGPMFDIHDNQHIHFEGRCGGDVTTEEAKRAKEEEKGDRKVSCEERREEELCHFVHPSVGAEREWQVHDEVRRLVSRQGIQEICHYLLQMRAENKLLLPQSPGVAYAELVRMGMSCGEGFSEKTFMKYYKNR